MWFVVSMPWLPLAMKREWKIVRQVKRVVTHRTKGCFSSSEDDGVCIVVPSIRVSSWRYRWFIRTRTIPNCLEEIIINEKYLKRVKRKLYCIGIILNHLIFVFHRDPEKLFNLRFFYIQNKKAYRLAISLSAQYKRALVWNWNKKNYLE